MDTISAVVPETHAGLAEGWANECVSTSEIKKISARMDGSSRP